MTREEYAKGLKEALSSKSLKTFEAFIESARETVGNDLADHFARATTKRKLLWMCDEIMNRPDMGESTVEWAINTKMEIWDDLQSFEEPENRA